MWCILVITYESKVEKHIIYVTMNYDMCNLTQNLLIMIMEVDMVYFQLTVAEVSCYRSNIQCYTC